MASLAFASLAIAILRAEEKTFPDSLLDSEFGYRKLLAEAFPGLELSFYQFTGRTTVGVIEDFDHERILLVLRFDFLDGPKFIRNGREFEPAQADIAKVKVSRNRNPDDAQTAPQARDIREEGLGYWIALAPEDTFSMTLNMNYPDRVRMQLDYSPDSGWRTSSQLLKVPEQDARAHPADAYELTRKSLLERVRAVLQEKPECVVRRRNDGIDLRIAPVPADPDPELYPLLVSLSDRMFARLGSAREELDHVQLDQRLKMYLSADQGAEVKPLVWLFVTSATEDARFREFITAVRSHDLRLILLIDRPYRACQGWWPEVHPAILRLEALKAPQVKIDSQPLTAAIHSLQQQFAPAKGAAVIDFMVRAQATGSDDSSHTPAPPLAPGPDPSVSLNLKDASFTAAIDALCVQAGYQWWIEEADGKPLLVLLPTPPAPAPAKSTHN